MSAATFIARSRIGRFCTGVVAPRVWFCAFHRRKASLWVGPATYTLSFDCDYPEDIAALPAVLATLRKYGIAASFACIGRWIEVYPDAHRTILADGHEVMNHAHTHPDHPTLAPGRSFVALTREERRAEIAACHDACVRVLGYAPVGFRTPHFGRAHTSDVPVILGEFGYAYSSSTVDVAVERYGVPQRDASGVWEIPLGTSARFPYALFDSWSAFRAPRRRFRDDAAFLDAFRASLAVVAETRSFLAHYFDPQDVVRNGRLDRMCAAIVASGVETVTCRALCTART